MLASLGFLVQEDFHPLFNGVGGPVKQQLSQLPVWLWAVMLTGVGGAEFNRIAVGWNKLDYSGPTRERPEGSEYYQGPGFRSMREDHYPGDLGFDPLNLAPKDPKEFRIMQEKAL